MSFCDTMRRLAVTVDMTQLPKAAATQIDFRFDRGAIARHEQEMLEGYVHLHLAEVN